MHLPKIEIDEQEMSRIARKFHILEMYLFGSVLRSDFSDDSDIDILIVIDPKAQLSYQDICDIKDTLEAALNRKVDIVEKAGITNPYRQREIFSTAVRIYAA